MSRQQMLTADEWTVNYRTICILCEILFQISHHLLNAEKAINNFIR